MTDYLVIAEVLAIHDNRIDRYGGSKGRPDDPGRPVGVLARTLEGWEQNKAGSYLR